MRGVLVNSSADLVGLKAGDFITQVEKLKITDAVSANKAISKLKVIVASDTVVNLFYLSNNQLSEVPTSLEPWEMDLSQVNWDENANDIGDIKYVDPSILTDEEKNILQTAISGKTKNNYSSCANSMPASSADGLVSRGDNDYIEQPNLFGSKCFLLSCTSTSVPRIRYPCVCASPTKVVCCYRCFV